jgi:hypothetical protein
LFIAKGLDVGDASIGSQVLQLFPGVTFIRFADGSQDPASYFQPFIDTMTAAKVVVEIEDHPWPLTNAYSGSQLTQESNWYASLAAAYKGNPYVWFGSENEPQGGDMSAQHVATYNAIRGQGANNMIMFVGGIGGGNPGTTGMAVLTPSDYASMTNIIWDLHFYGWSANFSTDQNTVNAALLGDSGTMILAMTGLISSDGVVPIIIGEFGPSTSGSSMDADAAQVETAVGSWAVTNNYTSGFAGWHWDADPYNALQNNGQLTSWGQTLLSLIKALP